MRDLLCVCTKKLGWNSTYLEIWSGYEVDRWVLLQPLKGCDEVPYIHADMWEDALSSCWALPARSPIVIDPSCCGVPGPAASDTLLTTQPPWTMARGPRFHVRVCVFLKRWHIAGVRVYKYCICLEHSCKRSDVYWTNMLLFLCLNLQQIVWRCMAIEWLIIWHGLHDQINQFPNMNWTCLFFMVSNTWHSKR